MAHNEEDKFLGVFVGLTIVPIILIVLAVLSPFFISIAIIFNAILHAPN